MESGRDVASESGYNRLHCLKVWLKVNAASSNVVCYEIHSEKGLACPVASGNT